MVGVLAQKYIKDKKAEIKRNSKKDSNEIILDEMEDELNDVSKALERKFLEATAEAVTELDKKIFDRCYKMAKEVT